MLNRYSFMVKWLLDHLHQTSPLILNNNINTKDIKDTNELLRQILDKMGNKPNQQEEGKEKKSSSEKKQKR